MTPSLRPPPPPGFDDRAPAPGELAIVEDFASAHFAEEPEERHRRPETVAAWIARHHLAHPPLHLAPRDIERVLRLRSGVRALLAAHDGGRVDGRAVSAINELSAKAPLVVRFEHGRPRLRPSGSGIDALLARLLAIIVAADADGTWVRLKICRADDCNVAFYDNSKNRSGAWCSMAECGNRAKARAFRERRRR